MVAPPIPADQLVAFGEPQECARCQRKPCLQSLPDTLDICIYGVAFYNSGTSIRKKREDVTMRHIAANLRHELNKILDYIINQANIIDLDLSLKRLDFGNPIGRIVGATQILDNFIELICGVYDFFPDEGAFATNNATPMNLSTTVQRLRDTYSLIKNSRRAETLRIRQSIPHDIYISRLPAVVEYLLVILTDNLWKYSFTAADVTIETKLVNSYLLDIVFTNHGVSIPRGDDPFSKGYQQDAASEGFGFGLYWGKILCDHYNRASMRESDLVDITHTQNELPNILIDEDDFELSSISQHEFAIRNISYERRT